MEHALFSSRKPSLGQYPGFVFQEPVLLYTIYNGTACCACLFEFAVGGEHLYASAVCLDVAFRGKLVEPQIAAVVVELFQLSLGGHPQPLRQVRKQRWDRCNASVKLD